MPRISTKPARKPAPVVADYEALADAWVAGRRVRKGEIVTLPRSAAKYRRDLRPVQAADAKAEAKPAAKPAKA